jgi:hypothetical protein
MHRCFSEVTEGQARGKEKKKREGKKNVNI